MNRRLMQLLMWAGLIGAVAAGAVADDWPTYRHDNQRSGVSTEAMAGPLSRDWVFTPTHPPSHAWSDPQPKPIEQVLELPRLRFDDAFHVAAVGGRVYFGSSADNKVYALDARTGQVVWQFYTDGPVRLAPTVWKDKVYAGSDDGKVYCLDAADGREIWQFRAAPSDEMVLGNGKMISLWPVRTGVLVDQDVAYFGAGLFPAEGLYLYAVNADNGSLLGKNDTYGQGGKGTVSPQGYMLASESKLFVPSGRSMPAAFSRQDGRFLFHPSLSWRNIGLSGGTYNVLVGDLLLNAAEQIVGVDEATGRLAFTEGLPASTPSKGSRRVVVEGGVMYMLTGEEAVAVELESWLSISKQLNKLREVRSKLERRARSGKEKLPPSVREKIERSLAEQTKLEARLKEATKWRVACECNDSMVMTPGRLFVGGADVVMGLEVDTGKKTWQAKVNGRARGLAAANGRLLVSTDQGSIHCFVRGQAGQKRRVRPEITPDPFAKSQLAKRYANALGDFDLGAFYATTAETIVQDSGVKRGYALILDMGTGQMAMELARRTDLMIYALARPAQIGALRQALDAAGLYGKRVVVLGASVDALPDYFANLIICERGFLLGGISIGTEDLLRLLKPCGGVAYVGRPPGAPEPLGRAPQPAPGEWLGQLREELVSLGEKDTTVAARGTWATIIRGPLPGAGRWTHQYADAGNTACSDDERVRGPIGILWFGQPGPGRMPSRHASNASPLAFGGRMFVQGENVIMAYDAYNGLLVWEREIPGALRLHLKNAVSNLAANDDSLFAAIGDKCLRIDAATGRTLQTYSAPPDRGDKPPKWEYMACVDDVLYGSRGSECVFAIDVDNGKLRWVYEGRRIMPTTICMGDGRVFFVDRRVTKQQLAQGLEGLEPEAQVDRHGKPIKPDVRLVVALDAETGRKLWQRPQYVSDCVKISKGGGELIAMYADGVLLLCGQPWNGHFWREFFGGEFSRRSLIALGADDGRELWSGRKGYRSRPLIVGDWIVAEPWAHDLKTGREKPRINPITGVKEKWQMARPGHHCGNIAAAPNALFFRSGSTAYYDLISDYGTVHFGAQRPGCWINCIPANGVVMMPEASSGCVCPYSLHCTIVFAPRKTNRVWGMYSAAGATTPVKRLALNFGAPGDRKDSRGGLWLAYPRPYRGRLVLDLRLGLKKHEVGDTFSDNTDFVQIENAEDGWIYASGYQGLARCRIPLIGEGQAGGKYTVRLHFADSENDQPGQRVFDVALQGQTVLTDFDIVGQAGCANRAVVKEFKGIAVKDELVVNLEPVRGQTLLCGVEVVRE